MKKYTTISTSTNHADVNEPVVLEEKETTRKVFVAGINDNPEKVKKGQTVSGIIVHQRKGKKGEWEDVKSINLSTLKAGEGVKLTLDSKQIKLLYDALSDLYNLSLDGVKFGKNEFTVEESNEIIKVPENRRQFINLLLKANHGEDVWNQLVGCDPDLAKRLSMSKIQIDRQKALDEFERNLKAEKDELYWQNFFKDNLWIFGYGLKYKFLNLVEDQPHFGGGNVTGKGGQKGDYLLSSEAEIKFTVLVEIKKPDTSLIARDRDGKDKKYRNGAYLLNKELLGSISQVQVNCKTWLRKSVEPENNDDLSKDNIFTISPRGIVVIGSTTQFSDDREKIETFEIFRNELHNPEIITFDELFERAKFIVQNNEVLEKPTPEQCQDDDIPF